ALPTAKIAVMGAEAAVNAVYANKIAAIEDETERAAFVAARREEDERDIDIVRLASELVVDSLVEPADLREEIVRRFALARGKDRHFSRRRHGVTPVWPEGEVPCSTRSTRRCARPWPSSPVRWSRPSSASTTRTT